MKSAEQTLPVLAAMLMVGAMAIIGVIDNYVIRLAETIGLWQFHMTRALMMLPLIAGLSLIGFGRLRPHRFRWVVLRSLLMTVAMLLYFSSLTMMPIAQALAGLFTSPIFILLITALFMKQRIGPWRIVAVALGFFGLLLVLQLNPRDFKPVVLLPVAAGFFYAIGSTITRVKCAGESTVAMLLVLVLVLGTAGAMGVIALTAYPVSAPAGADGFVTRGWIWPMNTAVPWVLLQAVGSTLAIFMLIKSYQLGEPSYVAVFEYSVMIFGPLFAWAVLGQNLDSAQVLGIGLITFAGGLLAWRTERSKSQVQPERAHS